MMFCLVLISSSKKRTILVTLNYRLGVFGFLSLQLPEYSGNMAMKDIQLALKWTNKNIERFGGDSNRITVFGHSAGIYHSMMTISIRKQSSKFNWFVC